MSPTLRRILLIAFAVLISAALIWVLVPARLLQTDAPNAAENLGEVPVNGVISEDLDLSPDVPPESPIPSGTEAKLPAPNFAVLTELEEEAAGGNTESLNELCKYVTGADLYDLGEYQVSEELAASCAELRQ